MRVLLLLALSGLIIACGQKGPLYLPDAEPPPADTCTTCPPVILPAPTASEATPAASSEADAEPKKDRTEPTDTPQESTP